MSDTSQNASSSYTVELRRVQDDDHEWLVALHNDPIVLHNLTNPNPISLESHLKWWNSLRPGELRLIFTVNGERAGFCKFYSIDGYNENCVLGADLHANFRGRGLAVPMWHLMLERCFEEWKLHRVSLTTAEYNHIAQHVYKKVGFKEEGRQIQSLYRNERFYDQIAMYLLREDYVKGKQ